MYGRILRDKNLGLGESYMEGWWDCPRLDEFIYRILSERLDEQAPGGLKLLVPVVQAFLFNRQSKTLSQIVAKQTLRSRQRPLYVLPRSIQPI